MTKYADATNYGKSIDPSSANIIDPGLLGGKVRVFQDTYTFGATSLNSQDYIVVGGKLPTGAQVVDIKLSMGSPAVSSNPSVVVGDEGTANRYITATQVTGGYVLSGPTAVGGMYYAVTGTTDNYIRVAGGAAGSILSGAVVKISVMYVVE